MLKKRKQSQFSGFTKDQKKYLLEIARKAILQYLDGNFIPHKQAIESILKQQRGAFVTLRRNGKLRGCIGQTDAAQSVEEIVRLMAVQAAFHDWRFNPVESSELAEIEIEISILTPKKAINNPEEIVLGRDGIALRKGGYSALFLPQVAIENSWDLRQTLNHLCHKAGLPHDSWKSQVQFFIFQAEIFCDADFS
ncbi:MAG: AmmeMemoRadiSam system protein A [Candidatus Marinimicrobia bacterium]|nr:AmmeMemoRadiSam system protein A [Candidatus Neomarinimicrobiota bacterium]